MRSQSWKPVVYLSTTVAGAAIVLGTLYLVVRGLYPEFSLFDLLQEAGQSTLFIAGLIAFGTVMAITWLLRRFFGRKFGTYLDDPDVIESTPRPPLEKICTRCGLRFAVHHNEFHAAGFCSRGCRDAFIRAAGLR